MHHYSPVLQTLKPNENIHRNNSQTFVRVYIVFLLQKTRAAMGRTRVLAACGEHNGTARSILLEFWRENSLERQPHPACDRPHSNSVLRHVFRHANQPAKNSSKTKNPVELWQFAAEGENLLRFTGDDEISKLRSMEQTVVGIIWEISRLWKNLLFSTTSIGLACLSGSVGLNYELKEFMRNQHPNWLPCIEIYESAATEFTTN